MSFIRFKTTAIAGICLCIVLLATSLYMLISGNISKGIAGFVYQITGIVLCIVLILIGNWVKSTRKAHYLDNAEKSSHYAMLIELTVMSVFGLAFSPLGILISHYEANSMPTEISLAIWGIMAYLFLGTLIVFFFTWLKYRPLEVNEEPGKNTTTLDGED